MQFTEPVGQFTNLNVKQMLDGNLSWCCFVGTSGSLGPGRAPVTALPSRLNAVIKPEPFTQALTMLVPPTDTSYESVLVGL
jgi:hypothetical protein